MDDLTTVPLPILVSGALILILSFTLGIASILVLLFPEKKERSSRSKWAIFPLRRLTTSVSPSNLQNVVRELVPQCKVQALAAKENGEFILLKEHLLLCKRGTGELILIFPTCDIRIQD